MTRLNSTTLQEEQERELAPEIEEERQIERPASAEPEEHVLHKDVRRLVDDGTITTSYKAFVPAFKTIKDVSAAKSFNVEQLPTDLMVTEDFIPGVKRPGRLTNSFVSD